MKKLIDLLFDGYIKLLFLEKTANQTPECRRKMTPAIRSKMTPFCRFKLTP